MGLLLSALIILLPMQAPSGPPRPTDGLVHGSGRWWHALTSGRARDGSGPPNVILQVCTPAGGSRGYHLSLYYDDPVELLSTKQVKESIHFRKIEDHFSPVNDYYERGGYEVKQFPRALFVGQGAEHGRPVTVVWTPGSENFRTIDQKLKVFDGDASHLDGVEHGSKAKGGYIVEHARASWLQRRDRPKWAKGRRRLKRTWVCSQD